MFCFKILKQTFKIQIAFVKNGELMCGLVGLAGNFQKELLFSMMESLKHRGEDSSGFYLYDGEDCCLCNDFDLFSDWKIEFPEVTVYMRNSRGIQV